MVDKWKDESVETITETLLENIFYNKYLLVLIMNAWNYERFLEL